MDGRVDWVSWVLWGLIPQLNNLLPNPTTLGHTDENGILIPMMVEGY